MNLAGARIGIVADYTQNADKRLEYKATQSLADYMIDRGSDVFVIPWEHFSGRVSLQLNYRENKEISGQSLSECVDLLHVRELGQLSAVQQEFGKCLDNLSELSMPIINSVAVMRRNLNKDYLLSFAQAGLPVAPLTMVASLEELELWRATEARAFADIVLKPLHFGELGQQVCLYNRMTEEDLLLLFSGGDSFIAQEFMPEIALGEKRLVFVGETFSHAVIKHITDGFKESSHKQVSSYQPSGDEIEIAKRIFDIWPDSIDVMRVDLVGSAKRCRIIEVELINPNLHEEQSNLGWRYPELFCQHILRNHLTREVL